MAKNYVDNASLASQVLRFQEVNDDTGEWLQTWRGKLKDKEEKLKFYEDKRNRRAAMTEEELAAEKVEAEALMASLCTKFMLIIKGRLSTRHFNKYDDKIKQDLAQNAILVMITKIRNFKRGPDGNAFSYFTQVSWVELIRTLREYYEYKNQHASLTFIEEFSDQYT